MRRRNFAGILFLIPFIIYLLLNNIFPESKNLLMAYIVAIAISLKGAILSFYTASKLKIIAFFKGLTLFQGVVLLIKRWFLDNFFSRWLQRNILKPMRIAIKEAKEYYLRLAFKRKLLNIISALLATMASIWLLYSGGYLIDLFLFTELKVIIISLSKTALLIIGKLFGILFNSWITPILEVLAFSWLFDWLERRLGKNHPINRFIASLARFFNLILAKLILLSKQTIEPLINRKVRRKAFAISKIAQKYIQDKKIAYELELFDEFERAILGAHIDAYYDFKHLEKIKDKQKLYSIINKEAKDGIKIVAFVSRDKDGNLLPVNIDDSFYNDLFLLESFATSKEYGVKKELSNRPDFSDFWILNTSLYPATLKSKSNLCPSSYIEPQSLKLIKCDGIVDYGSLYLEFNNQKEYFIPIKE